MTQLLQKAFQTAAQLPQEEHVQRQARQSYQFFLSDPHHPSLEFKRVSPQRSVYSVRVSIDYRAPGVSGRR